jgi:hypothetical protein
MPKFTLSDIAANEVLTSISVANIQDAEGFIAARCGYVPVDEETGRYPVFSRDDLLRPDTKQRRPATRFARKAFGVDFSGTYACKQWGLEFPLADEFRKTRKSPLADDRASVGILTQDMLITRELQFMAAYFTTGVWGTDVAGTTDFAKWDTAQADIIGSILSWSDTVKKASGRRPNHLRITPDVWRIVQNDPDIIDRVKHVSKESVTPDLVASLCKLKDVLVADAVYNSAQEGAAFSGAFVASKQALLSFEPDSPDLMTPSALYCASWTEFDIVREMTNQGAGAMFMYRDEPIKSDIYRGVSYYAFIIPSKDCGLFANNVIS